MTQQEFYIWLLNHKSKNYGLPIGFKSEFLKNYEIAKLVLEEFGISYLTKEDQAKLNLEAVSGWFRVSYYIYLLYDIPEILELLPERIVEDLDLQNSEIQSLPNLKSVGKDLCLFDSQIEYLPKLESVGWSLNLRYSQIQSLPKLSSVGDWLILQNSKIQSLPKLESIGGDLDLQNSQIQSLPKLESVEESLYLQNSQIQSLPQLESVGGSIFVDRDKLSYWRNYFYEAERPTLAERITLYD